MARDYKELARQFGARSGAHDTPFESLSYEQKKAFNIALSQGTITAKMLKGEGIDTITAGKIAQTGTARPEHLIIVQNMLTAITQQPRQHAEQPALANA